MPSPPASQEGLLSAESSLIVKERFKLSGGGQNNAASAKALANAAIGDGEDQKAQAADNDDNDYVFNEKVMGKL